VVIEMSILEHGSVKDWLSECRAFRTRRTYEVNIKRFFAWYGRPVDEFLKLDPKDMRHLALKYQNENESLKRNTVYGVLTALNSFLHYLDMPIDFKGKRVKPMPDLDSHTFSNGDLSKMFDVACTKEKAILSLGCSLGWEISAFLELTREFLQSHVNRARSENQKFVYFISQRRKTGAARLGVLNPTAIEWVGKWLDESQDMQKRKRKQNRKTRDHLESEVFDITEGGVNKMLRRLAKDAQIVKTGRVHFHRLRGWVMSGLSRAGFNEFQIKYVMGKAIPLADMTYLQTLQQEIEAKYPQAYEQCLNLKPSEITIIESKSKELNARLDLMEKENASLKAKLSEIGNEPRINKLEDELLKMRETLQKLLETKEG
jgi:integrase